MKKEDTNYLESLVHLCLVSTIVLLIWNNLDNLITRSHLIFQLMIYIITGIGGIMIYIPLGIKLIEIKEKYGKKI
jgi:hypothetical protein